MPTTYTETVTTRAEARGVHRSHRPVVSLLSDFGSREPSAGIMRAVIAAHRERHRHRRPHARRGQVRRARWRPAPLVGRAVPAGRGPSSRSSIRASARRATGIALQTLRGDFLIGPDNGLLMPAAARLGGITKAHILEDPRYRLSPVSTSFHGRDVFAPAAAHLATGTPIEDLGRPIDPRQLQELDWPRPVVRPGVLDSHVLYVDGFGNVKLSALGLDLNAALPGLRPGEPVLVRVGDGSAATTHRTTWAATFGAVARGSTLLYLDSFGRACLAVNQGSAAETLGLRTDDPLSIAREIHPSCHRRARRHRRPIRPGSAPALIGRADPRERAALSRRGSAAARRRRGCGRRRRAWRCRARGRRPGSAMSRSDPSSGWQAMPIEQRVPPDRSLPLRVPRPTCRRIRCATPIASRAVVDGRRSANSSPP